MKLRDLCPNLFVMIFWKIHNYLICLKLEHLDYRNEKEGIPMELLGYLDKTVEISQIGHTKSLNVHVTAALFIYRFFEQFIAMKI